jgi:2-(1,2-epoxy-1,2-dihydrophenyl)acetyl-CoA isomerase
VDSLAAKFASAPTAGLAAIKSAIRTGWSRSFDDQLQHERETQRTVGFSGDYKEGVAAFMEKSTAVQGEITNVVTPGLDPGSTFFSRGI